MDARGDRENCGVDASSQGWRGADAQCRTRETLRMKPDQHFSDIFD